MTNFIKQYIKDIVTYAYLKYYGVEVNFGKCKMIGFPVIKRNVNSRIIIEDNVTIVSKTKGNYAGVNNRSLLVTLSENAEIRLCYGSGISGAKLVAAKKIILGRYSGLGVNSVAYDTDFHPIGPKTRRQQTNIGEACSSAIIIDNDVLIGANSILLKGCRIGKCTVVGAGSIISSDLEPNSVYAGNPARLIRKIDRSGEL